MLILLTFPGSFNMPSHSPYCAKAMALLNMAQVPWRCEYLANPSPMPYGKLPVLRVGSRLIPDSENIRLYLEEQGADFWKGADGRARAEGHMMIRLAEESLAYGLVYDRWIDDRNWPVVRAKFFGGMPPVVRRAVPNLLRRKMRQGLQGHGIGRMSVEDRMARFTADLDALTHPLFARPYLLGEHPTAADAAVAPVLAMLESLPHETALRREVTTRPPLVDYIARTRPLYQPPVVAEGRATSLVASSPAADASA